jgi:hypothetical protein
MTIEFDSNRILSKKEREERVLDLYFDQNKNVCSGRPDVIGCQWRSRRIPNTKRYH